MVLPNTLPLVPYPASVALGEGLPFRLAADDANVVTRIDAGAKAESYTISVSAASAVLTAGDEAGLFYARQTFAQLVGEDAEGRFVPAVEIADAPRFPHRGVMLDIARHFHGTDVIKGFIDRASSLKFNRLHLHLSDDQGWRIQIDSWPLLTERASGTSSLGDPGGFLTKDDYREIVAYAAERHMLVIPEIDLPGHTHAVGVAYPDLVEEPVLNDHLVTQAAELGQDLPVHGEPFLGWGVGHSSVKIREERTYDFLRGVLEEIAELTPGPYLHIGGDEALGTPADDFDYFIGRITALVQERGKTPIAWHEAGAGTIAPGTIGQFWGSTTPDPAHAAATVNFAARGGSVILSPPTPPTST
ncbi:family 20 glycosylhydrolase [Microbacterium sp. NIBRBAC000506063]|uniref:family 20 glycosylhydrolase n=1 Tax=Microbacterium sp. NIBRBAC000506063 TaxID=2734618 RepID=UPI001CB72AA5|nr:family 20 glycosylhydrolase [Microbacterium sp. NIBRBAC000506063]